MRGLIGQLIVRPAAPRAVGRPLRRRAAQENEHFDPLRRVSGRTPRYGPTQPGGGAHQKLPRGELKNRRREKDVQTRSFASGRADWTRGRMERGHLRWRAAGRKRLDWPGWAYGWGATFQEPGLSLTARRRALGMHFPLPRAKLRFACPAAGGRMVAYRPTESGVIGARISLPNSGGGGIIL